MNKKEIEIKQGIKLHFIQTDLFKTDMLSAIITVPLTRENVTKNALIVSMLRRGTNNLKSQIEISKELENLYGAAFECGIDKYGDNQLLRFYIDSINDKFSLEENEEILKNSLEILLDIVCNPLLENGKFKQKYLDVEKENLAKMINSKIDDNIVAWIAKRRNFRNFLLLLRIFRIFLFKFSLHSIFKSKSTNISDTF